MTTNGDEAPASKYVTLISADGFEFVVLREATLISPTIKGMLRSPFAESKTGRCEFPEINADVLDKVVEYFLYWHKNVDKPNVPDMDIPPEICLQLLQAADFLGLDKQSS
ncbi:BTB/POZ protein [Schizothecium vesticola]|uniref:Elongin-C n=1 Tax=Schizothecium vesticola TaxID=314040 RepID=A0AA40EK36_9PEZI|nr:BTB/POZ protein [Schizothecium vesticola]